MFKLRSERSKLKSVLNKNVLLDEPGSRLSDYSAFINDLLWIEIIYYELKQFIMIQNNLLFSEWQQFEILRSSTR